MIRAFVVEDDEDVEVKQGSLCNLTIAKTQFQEFTSITPIHGVRYIGLPSTHHIRRFVYSCLVLVATCWVITYLYIASMKYTSYPVNTVISVQQTDELVFPAVTICNYNRYRKSYIKGTKLEQLLKQKFSPYAKVNLDMPSEGYLKDISDSRTNFELDAAHKKSSTVLQCHYRSGEMNIPCKPELNFTTTMTDYGVCYTFNDPGASDGYTPLSIRKGGSMDGLRLTLNVEQDEYSLGTNLGAGFKVNIIWPLSYNFPIARQCKTARLEDLISFEVNASSQGLVCTIVMLSLKTLGYLEISERTLIM
ncbi:acid-sensing ion channel 3-like [Glandiceps talaboti]